MFKRISGWRAWVLGAGGVLGVLTGLIGYADLAKAILPERYKAYVPLVMMFGFACALAAVGWEPEKVDAEPSIVINHRCDWDENEEGYRRYDYLRFQNVGNFPLTKVLLEPVTVLGISLRTHGAIEALLPGQAATEVQLSSFGSILDKIRQLRNKVNRPASTLTFSLKLRVRCLDWKQRESYMLEYELISHAYSDKIEVRRVHPGEDVKWTDFDALLARR